MKNLKLVTMMFLIIIGTQTIKAQYFNWSPIPWEAAANKIYIENNDRLILILEESNRYVTHITWMEKSKVGINEFIVTSDDGKTYELIVGNQEYFNEFMQITKDEMHEIMINMPQIKRLVTKDKHDGWYLNYATKGWFFKELF